MISNASIARQIEAVAMAGTAVAAREELEARGLVFIGSVGMAVRQGYLTQAGCMELGRPITLKELTNKKYFAMFAECPSDLCVLDAQGRRRRPCVPVFYRPKELGRPVRQEGHRRRYRRKKMGDYRHPEIQRATAVKELSMAGPGVAPREDLEAAGNIYMGSVSMAASLGYLTPRACERLGLPATPEEWTKALHFAMLADCHADFCILDALGNRRGPCLPVFYRPVALIDAFAYVRPHAPARRPLTARK